MNPNRRFFYSTQIPPVQKQRYSTRLHYHLASFWLEWGGYQTKKFSHIERKDPAGRSGFDWSRYKKPTRKRASSSWWIHFLDFACWPNVHEHRAYCALCWFITFLRSSHFTCSTNLDYQPTAPDPHDPSCPRSTHTLTWCGSWLLSLRAYCWSTCIVKSLCNLCTE